MKILVYDVAAENGGAATILNNCYNAAKTVHTDIEWLFVVSVIKLEEQDNIRVSSFPDVKKSWIKRYFFDKNTAPKLIKTYNPDIVLNLQNVYIKSKCKQIIYMHQSLPFIDYKFKFRDSKMWVYQNIIGRMIKSSCRKADEIIVQTKWIKDAIISQVKINADKITVQAPTIDESHIISYCRPKIIQYFFPANSSPYKNHEVIISALELVSKNDYFPKVVFTLCGEETDKIKDLKTRCTNSKLNVEWVGNLTYEEVFHMYSKSILLFPSYIETFGLPLLEAKLSGCPIIAADTLFAKEICANYEKVEYFDKFDYIKLGELINSEYVRI